MSLIAPRTYWLTYKGPFPLSVERLERCKLAALAPLEVGLQRLVGLFLLPKLVFSSFHVAQNEKRKACMCLAAACATPCPMLTPYSL